MDRFEQYLPLVKHAAARASASSPHWFDYEDAFSAGCVGLLAAIEKRRTDPRKTFTAYARIKIAGAIKDEIKRLDPVPRRVRAAARRDTLTDADRQDLLLASPYYVRSTDSDYLASHYPGQYVIVLWRECRRILGTLISTLPSRDKKILDMLIADKPYNEIAAKVGLTESRICQKYKEITNRLRSMARRQEVVTKKAGN
jgi:RNA polymerase sigma factor for flagellar operon FliA